SVRRHCRAQNDGGEACRSAVGMTKTAILVAAIPAGSPENQTAGPCAIADNVKRVAKNILIGAPQSSERISGMAAYRQTVRMECMAAVQARGSRLWAINGLAFTPWAIWTPVTRNGPSAPEQKHSAPALRGRDELIDRLALLERIVAEGRRSTDNGPCHFTNTLSLRP